MSKAERDFAESLVLEVQKRPAIYAPSHRDHKDRYKIGLEWTAIAVQLNSTVEVVKRRWQNLRGSFSKSLSALKNKAGGSSMAPRPAFYLFEQMKFLQHHMGHAPMHDNYGNLEEFDVILNTHITGDEQPEEEIQEAAVEEELDCRLETLSSSTLSVSSVDSTSGAAQRKRPRQEQDQQPCDEPAAEHKYLRNKISKEDSDLSFFKGLLPMVKGLKQKNKLKYFAEATSLLLYHIQQQDAE